MLIIHSMEEQLRQITARIEEIEAALKASPEGSLIICTHNNHRKHYQYIDGRRNYLRKDSPLLPKLARKKCLEFELKQLKANLAATDMYVRHAPDPTEDVMSFLRQNEALCDILKAAPSVSDLSLAEWVLDEAPPESKPVPFPENRIHKMKSGHLVRTKIEGMIDTGLFDAGIPFRYEDPLTLVNGTVCYPDFTIRHPLTGAYYYWEHFGMMDDPDYVSSALKKIGSYIRSGYLPGRELIMTFETKYRPLPNEEIALIIEKYFK